MNKTTPHLILNDDTGDWQEFEGGGQKNYWVCHDRILQLVSAHLGDDVARRLDTGKFYIEIDVSDEPLAGYTKLDITYADRYEERGDVIISDDATGMETDVFSCLQEFLEMNFLVDTEPRELWFHLSYDYVEKADAID